MRGRTMTTLRWVFSGPRGVRSGWRWMVFWSGGTIATVLMGALTFGLISAVFVSESELFLQAWPVLYLVLPLWSVACSALIDRTGARTAGLGGPPVRSLLELGIGFGIGGLLNAGCLALISTLGALGLVDGGVSIQVSTLGAQELGAWFGWAALFAVAATWEEVVFRGYGMLWAARALTRSAHWASAAARWPVSFRTATAVGYGPVVVVSCLWFGIAHLGNPANSGLIPLANTMIAGLWLLIAIYRTRALWAAIGMHWGWNATMALVLGVPVSGMGSEDSGVTIPGLLTTSLSGPDWFTGGAYGLEGSIFGTVVLCAGCVTSWAWPVHTERPPLFDDPVPPHQET